MSPIALLLAAGKGTRMRSERPKVLHELGGRPLVAHPLAAAAAAGCRRALLVVGHGAEAVEASAVAHAPAGLHLDFALQRQQLGTGHAVAAALDELPDDATPVWILSGDVPLLRAETLVRMHEALAVGAALVMLSFRPADPAAYGRVLRDDDGEVLCIREYKDADESERAVDECNAGVYCVRAETLQQFIPTLGRDNAQGEVYLTDLIELMRDEDGPRAVRCFEVDPLEVAGVNTPEQLAALEAVWAARSSA